MLFHIDHCLYKNDLAFFLMYFILNIETVQMLSPQTLTRCLIQDDHHATPPLLILKYATLGFHQFEIQDKKFKESPLKIGF